MFPASRRLTRDLRSLETAGFTRFCGFCLFPLVSALYASTIEYNGILQAGRAKIAKSAGKKIVYFFSDGSGGFQGPSLCVSGSPRGDLGL